MVKHSLWKLLKKYPYFLDKRKGSNLYKVTKVYNSLFKDLYNSLFHIYESFHLNKRLLTWKTQNKPYVYTIHFRCGYANIKLIKIYKNDILIHQEEFSEDVAKERTENEIIYSWDYECSYLKTNMLPIKVYRCVECDAIYFGDELPYDCVGDNCNSNTYITTNIYRCDNCGEIYFYNPEEDGYINIDCKNNCNSTFTQVYAYRCMGDVVDSDNEFDEEIDGLGHNLVNEDCGEIYIGDEPPSVCNVCGAPMLIKEGKYGQFLACSNYPRCKNIKKIVEPVGTCPKCGASIVKKITKTGKTYYGCVNNTSTPKCDFMTWDKPAPYLCPTCGGFMKAVEKEDGTIYVCTNRLCKHVERPQED